MTTMNEPEVLQKVPSEAAKPLAPVRREVFTPDKTDGYFALAAFVLGFLFVRWLLLSFEGWGVGLFTLLYAASVTVYFRAKGKVLPRESWFWLAVLVLTGLSFALWQGNGLEPWREFFLFGVAIYWVLVATNATLLPGTSNWLPLDGLHGLVVIPFGNFFTQYKGLSALTKKKDANRKPIWPIVLGVALALLITASVLPLLMEADNGGFTAILDNIWFRISWMRITSLEIMLQSLLAIPTAAYIYGLVAGSAHKRVSTSFKQASAEGAVESLRLLPAVTIYIVLAAVTGLYVVFILSQVPYFFSAFVGARPEGWQVYSEYARNGFFELVRIAVLNLSLLAAASLGIQKQAKNHKPLKVFSCMLSLLTLLLIATAWSKMALYISVYGLSVKRLLPCVFMVFLAIVCLGVIALQRRSFSIVRLAAITGAILFCLLSLSDPDSFVTRYNANRYLAGTLNNFDVEILYRAGAAGIDGALLVYENTTDEELKNRIEGYFGYWWQGPNTMWTAGSTSDTLQAALARQKVSKYLGSKH